MNRRLLEIEDSNHHEYYNELRDAWTILMDWDTPRIVSGFEHVVEEYKQQIENDDCLTMRGLRGSIIEGIAMIEKPTEDDVRAEAENYIKTMSNYSP